MSTTVADKNAIRKLFERKIHDVIVDDLKSGLAGSYSNEQILQYIKRNKHNIDCCIVDIIYEKEIDDTFEPDEDWIREYLGECDMQ